MMCNDRGEVDIIIKLGGSAITIKNQFETLELNCIAVACDLIRQCVNAEKRVVVIHGAGSFGHFQAKQYGVQSGFKSSQLSEDEIRKGFCSTRQSVTKLQTYIVNEMLGAGVHAVALSPCGTWCTDRGSVVRSGTAAVREVVQNGFTPVLHGDCVLDATLGCTILSGDTIIETLCREMTVGQVVFLTDVDGIYDKPPSDPDSRRITWICVTPTGDTDVTVESNSSTHDVTGGIRLKMQTAVNIVHETRGRTPVIVCGIQSDVALRACLHGVNRVDGEGTLVTLNT